MCRSGCVVGGAALGNLRGCIHHEQCQYEESQLPVEGACSIEQFQMERADGLAVYFT